MSKQAEYINRELSWLEFNHRVLEEAQCADNPLLERVKFLAITASNLDEFFRVRVGSLTVVADSAAENTDIAGLGASQQLELIRDRVLKFHRHQYECYSNLERSLRKHGIVRLLTSDLDDSQMLFLKQYFDDELLSTITPMAIDHVEEFPTLAGERLCLCVRLRNDINRRLPGIKTPDGDRDDRFLIIPLGKSLPRMVTVPADERHAFVFLEDVVGQFLGQIFGGQEVVEWAPFRLIRNADITLDEDAAADLLSGMEAMLEAREKLECVRLEVADGASEELVTFLQTCLEASDRTVYRLAGPLDFSALFALAGLKGFASLKDPPWPPQPSPDFPPDCDPFDVITEKDRVLYHPYQAYDPVVSFVRFAADDPQVMAIKQTLYRTARDSDIAKALIKAAENGKNVTAIVELKARFDEARNIQWAKQMERAGVDVIYGVRGLKTHAKVCLVVRREPSGIRRYAHFGTGNYNESTASLYSDASYFTCNESLGLDAVHFFNAITGLSVPQPLESIAAAPINLRDSLLDLIRVETDHAAAGNAAQITAKLNSLADQEVIDALYQASQKGVDIRLNIRGICCLRPGVKGLSENIQVVSVVDRLLEHARIISFRHGGDFPLFISSADWMGRNLDRRVELMVPIEDKKCKARLTSILEAYFKDNVKARKLNADGTYSRVPKPAGQIPYRSQQQLYDEAREIFAAHTDPRTTVFKPHRGESA